MIMTIINSDTKNGSKSSVSVNAKEYLSIMSAEVKEITAVSNDAVASAK